jgi:hypothetical protein
MRRQLITMRMGMRCMLGRENRLFNGFMRGMRKGVIGRMMPGILKMTFPVLAGSGFEARGCIGFLRLLCTSR